MRTVSLNRLLLGAFLLAEVGFVVLLAGCGATFDYDGLRETEAEGEGEGFNAALAREYKDFALFETDLMMDWPDAAHFGAKAMAVAGGAQIPPEDPKDWNLPEETRDEIVLGRTRLVRALDQGADQRWPETAARAQARFDCWVEQQEENWQADDIARCRKGFYEAMNDIDTELAVSAAAADTDLIPASVSTAAEGTTPVEPAPPAVEPQRFLILFDFDSARLAPETAPILDAIAEAAQRGRDVTVAANGADGLDDIGIAVAGHADRAGGDSYNLALSWRRAETVGDALVERGVTAERITLAAYGEQDPMIATNDGVREPRNRRVEIIVGEDTDL